MPLMHDADVPMSLGDHLEELRRRLKWPLIILGIGFFTAFMYEATLQQIFAQPMAWATLLYPNQAKAVGLPNDGSLPKFMIHGVMEGPMSSMLVSFYAAFFVAFPVLVYSCGSSSASAWFRVNAAWPSSLCRLASCFSMPERCSATSSACRITTAS